MLIKDPLAIIRDLEYNKGKMIQGDIMLSFISAKEAAEKWNISQRRVSVLCSENRINGAMIVGNMWIIPSNAEKPIDKRTVRKKEKKEYRKFEIKIKETVSEVFTLFAVNEEDAIDKAIEKYNKCEFVLEPGELVAKQMKVHDVKNNLYTEWIEF